ncbi:hypothetical protein C0J50_1184 [Silurus asotus]|uniref:Uncharacterized protein n=1 Tax=Silurus asotus TaxID=30991 RepID=A0AAD5A7N9_SILAS|nr:hypothetical protein C0J50_1184 [Silurus asotus]
MLFARLRRFFFSPVCPKQLPQEHVQHRWNQTPRNVISRAVESQNRTARSARQYPACLKEQGPCGESGSRAKAGGGGGPSDPSERFRAGSLAGFQSRSPVFRLWSRSSSGYFSFDSEPSSPISTQNTATQTPSPASQAITHFLQRISHAHNHVYSDHSSDLLQVLAFQQRLHTCRCDTLFTFFNAFMSSSTEMIT